jgi:hypothetical protein
MEGLLIDTKRFFMVIFSKIMEAFLCCESFLDSKLELFFKLNNVSSKKYQKFNDP